MSVALLQSDSRPRASAPSSTRAAWAGRILTGVLVLLLAFDVGTKLFPTKAVLDGARQMGMPLHLLPVIGAIGLVCLVLYIVPRTAPLGAVLWTGYFGGAVATNLRLELPLFSYTLAPLYVGVLIWLALYLRDERVRVLVRSLF